MLQKLAKILSYQAPFMDVSQTTWVFGMPQHVLLFKCMSIDVTRLHGRRS